MHNLVLNIIKHHTMAYAHIYNMCTHTHTHSIYIHTYIYMCVCVRALCVFVQENLSLFIHKMSFKPCPISHLTIISIPRQWITSNQANKIYFNQISNHLLSDQSPIHNHTPHTTHHTHCNHILFSAY